MRNMLEEFQSSLQSLDLLHYTYCPNVVVPKGKQEA